MSWYRVVAGWSIDLMISEPFATHINAMKYAERAVNWDVWRYTSVQKLTRGKWRTVAVVGPRAYHKTGAPHRLVYPESLDRRNRGAR